MATTITTTTLLQVVTVKEAQGGSQSEVVTSELSSTSANLTDTKKDHFRVPFIKTPRFWIVLLIGQFLSFCLVGTNTFSQLLANRNTNIPAFQNLFNYFLLNIVYTSYTIYKYGFVGYRDMLLKDGWKYFILSVFDVEGNYFVVLGFRYTTLLSAQLINYWSIVVVVILSFLVLKVRYHWTQLLGILICCGGLGVLLASSHINGGLQLHGGALNELKGNLFMFLGATFYGLSNLAEEYLVSKRPIYEVVGQLGLWGVLINGVQASIFDRNQFKGAMWDGKTGGYLTGYTLCLFLFYVAAPLQLRMSSAAFFDISLLSSSFWGVLIGIKVFGYTIYRLYIVAIVLIIVGLLIYYSMKSFLGESKKPWLGEEQEDGIEGLGTAKREIAKARAASNEQRHEAGDSNV